MNVNSGNNDNWVACPRCGEPLLIDPKSGKAEACANCASLANKKMGTIGIGLVMTGVAIVVALVYICIRIVI
jgi:uncharacterized protein (DUF983 family)